jgi:hypothetical protein
LERELNGIEKFLFSEWLRQKLDRASLHGTYCNRDIAVPAGYEERSTQ